MVNAESDPEGQARADAFRQALASFGWTEHRNVQINYRWGASDDERAQSHAAGLLSLMPDVVVVNGTPALAAVRRLTRTVPIIFVVVTDPVGSGYVESLARPGANITGFSTFEPEIGGKWLELLKELSPAVTRIAAISDPSFAGFAAIWDAIVKMASTRGLQAKQIVLHDPMDDIESPLGMLASEPGGGLIVLPTAINNASRARIFGLAAIVAVSA
jgi:putative ABC transport system substrate-binding protein